MLCLTWLGVRDVHVEDDDDDEGDDGGEPVDGEHDEDAQEGAQEGDPLVVVLERGTPAWIIIIIIMEIRWCFIDFFKIIPGCLVTVAWKTEKLTRA